MLACPLRVMLGPVVKAGLGDWVVGAAAAEEPDGRCVVAAAQGSQTVQDLRLDQGQGAMLGHAHFALCCWDELLCWLPQWCWVAWWS